MTLQEDLDNTVKILPDGKRYGSFTIEREIIIPPSGEIADPLYRDIVQIPNTSAFQDVTVISNRIINVVDVKYIFPDVLNNVIRFNKALIQNDRITLNASLDLVDSSVIFIGTVV